MSTLMKIRLVGAEFHADRRTDGRIDRHDERNSRFSQILRTRLKRTTIREGAVTRRCDFVIQRFRLHVTTWPRYASITVLV